MILKDDTVLLRDFKREDIAKRIEWETEVHKSVGGMGGDM